MHTLAAWACSTRIPTHTWLPPMGHNQRQHPGCHRTNSTVQFTQTHFVTDIGIQYWHALCTNAPRLQAHGLGVPQHSIAFRFVVRSVATCVDAVVATCVDAALFGRPKAASPRVGISLRPFVQQPNCCASRSSSYCVLLLLSLVLLPCWLLLLLLLSCYRCCCSY